MEKIEVRQDSSIRIMVLCTKLGKSPESISRIMKVEQSDVEKNIEYALSWGLIKNNELKGIQLLENPNEDEEFKELGK